jgi:hypothetical protein
MLLESASSSGGAKMENQSPARLYALIFGAVLVLAGIIGFFYSSDFASPGRVSPVLGILDVNGWHNVVHIVTGVLGLAAYAAGAYAARTYALALGAIYIVVAVWGFIVGDGGAILGFLPVNTEDNVLHLIIGLVGLAAGAAPTRRTAAPAEERTASPGP